MRVKSGNSSAGAKRAINLRYSSPQRSEMRDTVRCPNCVSGLEFRPMVPHPDGRYICDKCGHTAHPGNTKYKCRCPKCLEFGCVNRKLSGSARLVAESSLREPRELNDFQKQEYIHDLALVDLFSGNAVAISLAWGRSGMSFSFLLGCCLLACRSPTTDVVNAWVMS
jgi:ribosomal protein S27AE